MTELISTAAKGTFELLVKKPGKAFEIIAGVLLFALFLSYGSFLPSGRSSFLPYPDPLEIAEHALNVLGVPDAGWLDAYAVWVHRPELALFLPLAAAASGIALLCGSWSGIYVSWLLLIATSAGIGWTEALATAGRAFALGVSMLAFLAWTTRGTAEGRRLRAPRHIISETLLGTAVGFVLAPIAPVLWAMEIILDRYTLKPAKTAANPEQGPADADQPVSPDRLSRVYSDDRPVATRRPVSGPKPTRRLQPPMAGRRAGRPPSLLTSSNTRSRRGTLYRHLPSRS